jgi:23S rRNA pseudouridine1911/1915/1917 synthase
MTDSGTAEQTFVVEAAEAGLRLDQFLAERCADISRSRIHTDMKDGRVLVDGRARAKGFRVGAGASITYRPAPREPMAAVAQDIPLDIVHRDEHLLIVNKAAGMVVHPAVGHPDGTLVNALMYHCRDLAAAGDPLRPGIVHRLDRDTTGLMAVALTEHAHHHLADQLKDRRMGRIYRTLSWGQWPDDAGVLTGAIGRHPRLRQKMAVVERGGRSATTRYTVLEDFGFVQSCRVELETGRTHQIRVHFAHHGHPVVGDHMYGDDKRARGIHNLDRTQADRMVKLAARQMLHAAELHLEHPETGEQMQFAADLPPDMAAVLAGLNSTG